VAFTRADELFLLGDYVDRGPDSKGVIDAIWRLQADGYTVHCLMGNHEEMTLDNLRELQQLTPYASPSAGDATLLASFGARDLLEIPKEYFEWMRQLPRYLLLPDYVLVHAGLNFREEDPLSDTHNMLWIRPYGWYNHINHDWLNGRLVVHGHTPQRLAELRSFADNYAEMPVQNIDAGCFVIDRPGMGHLCCFDLTNRTLTFRPNVDQTQY
jgi:serine/threonine protein phosphatase 1